MYKNILILFTTLFFVGCSTTTTMQIPSSKKVYEKEDLIIMLALRAEQLDEYDASSSMFNTLYEKSGKKEYLYRSIQNDLIQKKNQQVVDRIDKITKGSFDDYILVRYKILALSRLERLQEAKTAAIMLLELTDESSDYHIVSNIYIALGKYNTALKYLESAYLKNFDAKILDSMSVLLYVNLNRKKDAIAQLESHILMHGCQKDICKRLISFYSEQNNIDGLLSIYFRMYEQEKDEDIAEQIVQILGYKKDYIKLIEFLQKNEVDNKLLLQLYIQSKDYKKATQMADELYEATAELNYLGQSAIFEYESSLDKNDKNMHKRVMEKLKKVILDDPNPLYLNYLGYLMIDHEINVKEGMKYVQEALEQKPNSEYYLDSLAWGYYKLGQCNKAKKIMKKLLKIEGALDEPEVIEHNKKIKKCKTKNKKGKK